MKKGAVEADTIVKLVIVIIGFVIIIGFILLKLDLFGQTEDEICELSVLGRATSPDVLQSAAPLKCNTKKICLTRDGDCRKNFAGENPKVIKLAKDENEAIKQIEKTTADALLNCWKMMGEGKLDLFGNFKGQFGWDEYQATCVICSRIAIDEGFPTKGSGKKLDDIHINKYMQDNIIPELGVNYISALTKGGAVSYAKQDPVKVEAFVGQNKAEDSEGNEIKLGEEDNDIPNRELAIVFMQFKTESPSNVASNILKVGATGIGATFMTPIAGTAARAIVSNPVTGTLAVATAVGAVGYGMYNAYQGQLAAAGYCGPFSSRDGKAGCSIVQGINYNYKDINKICPQIQGNL